MAGGTWIKSPRGPYPPTACCECQPDVCDGCGYCGTPADCLTIDVEGDAFVFCGKVFCPPAGDPTLTGGSQAESNGIIQMCGGSTGCTLDILILDTPNPTTGGGPYIADPLRSLELWVDGIPVTIVYEASEAFDGTWWRGSIGLVLGPGECVEIEYAVGATSFDIWNIYVSCVEE